MNKSQNKTGSIEDQLADFTDQILDEESPKQGNPPFATDPELRALEQTVQRLKHAFDEDGPSEAAIRRMRKNIVMQWQAGERKQNESFWEKITVVFNISRHKWRSQRSRQYQSLGFSLAAVAMVMLVSIFLLKGVGSEQPAASGQTLSAGFLIAFSVLFLLTLWFFRRKP